jgi:hypothetical protein
MNKLLVAIALVGVGCVGGGKPASAACEETAECDDGLTCLPFAVFEQNVCREIGTTCSTTCETDADCAPLGSTFKCFANCDGMACGDTASP